VLEDVHWADAATLDVLRLPARRVESVSALVVVSYRGEELEEVDVRYRAADGFRKFLATARTYLVGFQSSD
jgi:predicted ATPase